MKNTAKAIICTMLAALLLTASSCTAVKVEKTPEIPEKPIENTEEEKETDEEQEEEIIENLPTLPAEAPENEVFEYKNVTVEVIPDDETLAAWGDIFTSSFRVPAIALESDNAKAFNEKILAEYPSYGFAEVSESPVSAERIYRYDYISDVNDRAVVAIVLQKQIGYFYSEYGTVFKAFYYDLKGDCEVTAQDYLDSLDINYDELYSNIQKDLYVKAAHGQVSSSYDLSYVDEYTTTGDVVIASENDGFVLVDVSGEYGYYLEEFPIFSEDSVKALCTQDAHIYATPSPEAEVLCVLDKDTEVFILTKTSLAEGLDTIEFDTQFSWYAVEYNGIHGYMLEHELNT